MDILIKDMNDIPARASASEPGILVKSLLDNHNSRSMKAGLMSCGPHTKDHLHYHTAEELQFVLNGHAILKDINGKKYPLKPGSVVFCPSSLEGTHSIENTSDFPVTLLFIFADQDSETIEYNTIPEKQPFDKIVVRDIKDIKLDVHSFPGVRMKIICEGSIAQNILAGIMWWEPGSKLPPSEQPHYHNIEEFQFVLYGNSTLTDCDGKKHPLSEGVSFLCAPGIEGAHGVENTSDLPMTLFFAYPTQDFESTPYLTL